MASYFSITTATNSIQLNDKRTAEASFSIYNSSGRTMGARVRLTALQPEAASWISLEGQSDRNFGIAETAQYAAAISVPAEAPAGPYTFRLDVVGEENPDEDFSEGPTVTFVVPEPVIVEKKPFPWWIVAVGVAVVVIAVVGYIVWPKKADVPEVAKMTLVDAQSTLQTAGFSVATTTIDEASDSVPAGQVVRTEPAVGESVRKGSEITLVLSTGPTQVEVPDVSKQTVAKATALLQNAGFVVSETTNQTSSDTIPSGAVVSTAPKAGTSIAKGSEVTLVVSSGPQLVAVPNVKGMTVAAATKAIETAGLVVSDQTAVITGGSVGTVAATTPAIGTKVPLKTGVKLSVVVVITIPTIPIPTLLPF